MRADSVLLLLDQSRRYQPTKNTHLTQRQDTIAKMDCTWKSEKLQKTSNGWHICSLPKRNKTKSQSYQIFQMCCTFVNLFCLGSFCVGDNIIKTAPGSVWLSKPFYLLDSMVLDNNLVTFMLCMLCVCHSIQTTQLSSKITDIQNKMLSLAEMKYCLTTHFLYWICFWLIFWKILFSPHSFHLVCGFHCSPYNFWMLASILT